MASPTPSKPTQNGTSQHISNGMPAPSQTPQSKPASKSVPKTKKGNRSKSMVRVDLKALFDGVTTMTPQLRRVCSSLGDDEGPILKYSEIFSPRPPCTFNQRRSRTRGRVERLSKEFPKDSDELVSFCSLKVLALNFTTLLFLLSFDLQTS